MSPIYTHWVSYKHILKIIYYNKKGGGDHPAAKELLMNYMASEAAALVIEAEELRDVNPL
jgi:hypothetical protein